MAGLSEDPDRQVIPRWRSFKSTLDHGELSSLSLPIDPHDWRGALDELSKDWSHHKGISTAADLLSAAFVSGRESDAADAARFLLTQNGVPFGARTIAAICLQKLGERGPLITEALSQVDPAESPVSHSAHERQFQIEIHTAREQLSNYPRNAALWSNLSRLYASVGSLKKAKGAMRVALGLAPENRFILRAAARLMLHHREVRQAHLLLASAKTLKHDPWVLSAEIATAGVLGRTSKNIKLARKMLETGRFNPIHVSELASALGTLEAAAGNRKASRLLISQSLQSPSENAVAQAAWLARNAGILTSTGVEVSLSAEATAWQSFRVANWSRSIQGTRDWWADQPFSSRPAIHGSHIASTVLEDYDQAIEFAQFALLSNPGDVCLYNNLAFALAQQGNVMRAAKELSRIDRTSVSAAQLIYVLATAGLIEFRSGRIEAGRALYRESFDVARDFNLERGKLALVYLALEELRSGLPSAEESRRKALDAASGLTELWCQVVVSRLRSYPSTVGHTLSS